jgi:hypothetical protein
MACMYGAVLYVSICTIHCIEETKAHNKEWILTVRASSNTFSIPRAFNLIANWGFFWRKEEEENKEQEEEEG